MAVLAKDAGEVEAKQQAPSRPPRLDSGAAAAPYDPGVAAQDEERMKMVMEERRRRIPADTERLVQLAREFKVMVDGSTTDERSVAAIRKAGEIEKLARDLKSRMRN